MPYLKETPVMSSLVLLVVVLFVLLLVDPAHRYLKVATPMLVGLGGMTGIAAVVVPVVVR
ncbi:hypothetical protein [Streptomyces nitrosporeus]|uniref:hypothetical protein n=1 Tax=Streptomyces nitrosporeus TaxID=28894 RepID=UPI00142EC61C|nr:hypothetical protein [Streptomyces nitrosporeus]